MTAGQDTEAGEFRFETRLPLRHTDSFGGTPFVHGGVLLALTEIALDAYDREAGIPSHREILRFQARSEIRYLAPLRWDDAAVVRLRCSHVSPGRLIFECEVAAASTGRPVCRMTHRYAYVNAATGRAVTPSDWPAIVSAIRGYESNVEISNGDAETAPATTGGGAGA